MRLLLDTHAFLWWLAGNAKLSKRARNYIADEDVDVLVSAASVWKIATKFRLGKLPGARAIIGNIGGAITSQAFTPLSVAVVHAERAGTLPGEHRDPFDRMLIAQAQLEGLALVSNERLFDAYGVERVW